MEINYVKNGLIFIFHLLILLIFIDHLLCFRRYAINKIINLG